MKQTILFTLLLTLYLACELIHSKDVKFCMPPVASFNQNVRIVSSPDNIAKKIKTQYDITIKKQRMDTYTLDNTLIASQILVIDANNNTLVYLLIGNSCACYNNGNTGMDGVYSQCITEPVIEKDTIAELPALKVGTSSQNSGNINENVYWITPAKETGYWWLLSRMEYQSSEASLIDTVYTGHSLVIDSKAFEIPANCPKVCRSNPNPNILKSFSHLL